MLRTLYSIVSAIVLSSTLCSPVYSQPTPALTAKAWLVADTEGKILGGTNITDVRSIASITKLITVMIVLDANQRLDEIITSNLYNRQMTRRELIGLAIIKSDNKAAKILCEKYTTGYNGCVTAMNEKALALSMEHTRFVEPTGLYNENVSTAEDLLKLVMAASKYQIINEDSNKDKILFSTKNKRFTEFGNTNKLVGKGYEFLVSKTGWITRSGGCIVMMVNTNLGQRIVVLLGSKDTKTRIPEARLIAFSY